MLRGEKNPPPNCIGFAFWKMGINRKEVYVKPRSVIAFRNVIEPVKRTDPADLIGVVRFGVDPLCGLLVHLAVIDQQYPNFLFHRPGLGEKIVREEFDLALEIYLLHKPNFLIVPFRLTKGFTR